MLGFWASRNVPIRKFVISYPNGRKISPEFRKFVQSDGSVIFKFKEPVAFARGDKFSWISAVPFEAKVSPIFQAETEAEQKLLQIDHYKLRLLQFQKEVE